MKTGLLTSLFLAVLIATAQQTYKPYTLTLENTLGITATKTQIAIPLKTAGFTVVGEYQPADDANRWVMALSHPDLTKAVSKVGGLTAFCSVIRLAITQEGGKTLVSYTTPEYWARAYFRDDYNKVSIQIDAVTRALDQAFKPLSGYKKVEFGSKKGLDADDLDDYNYMIGMPEFDDTEELREFSSYAEAIKTIDNNFKKGVKDVTLVYKYTVPGKNLTLYGVALEGMNGEANFLPTIDIGTPKHTAFLPYEFLVMDNEVHMLHGRFRIAISFPDLTMGTFTKIMSTPGNIEDMLKRAVE